MFRHGSASKGAIRTRNRDNMNEHGARERVSYAEMTIVNVQETLRAKAELVLAVYRMQQNRL